MAAPKKKSLYQTQKASKPSAEDVAGASLQGAEKQGALEFLAFIKTLKMTPQWASGNSWTFNYKNKRVGYFQMRGADNAWQLSLYSQYDAFFNDLVSQEAPEIREFIVANAKPCHQCGSLAPGVNITLLGKEFKNMCAIPCVLLKNPDAQFRGFAQRLVVLRRDAIANNRVPNCYYIKMSAR